MGDKKMSVLSNKDLKVGFSKENGNLTELYLKRKGFGKWNGWESYLVIVDEMKEKTYRDTESPLVLSQRRYGREKDEIIENLKEFKAADFSVKEIWKVDKDSLSWRVEVSLKKNRRERTIQIKQLIPYPKPAYGLGVWSAQSQFPIKIERVAGLHLAYGDICFGTVIPAITLYKEKEDIGLTISKPFGLKTAKLAFSFQDYWGQGVEIETGMLGLRKDKPAIVEFVIHPHEGCWRPGLAWLYKKYPRYFDPPNKRVREIEGGFLFSHPFIKEEEVKSVLSSNVKWEELHHHFPYCGQYAPKEEQWENESSLEQPEANSSGKVSSKIVKKHIKMVHRYGIKCLIYFQCAGDGYIPYVTKKFPDAIAKDTGASPAPAWINCCLMNSDSCTSFGKEMLNMIDKFLKMYPDMDGVFLDQLCYNILDIAHDDGITMYKNKPAYLLWHCYEKPVKKLAAKLHEQGKLIFANGPYNIEVQKDIDGHMAEGQSWAADVLKYLCICKPLLFLSYYKNAYEVESMFHQCLLCGASYSVWPYPSEEIKKVLKIYIPLVEKLYGRRWLLEPNPAQFPEGCNGNIFLGEKNDIIVTMTSKRRSVLDEKGIEKNLKIYLKFRDVDKIKKGYSLGTHYQGRREVKVKRERKFFTLTVAEHSSATVIILEK